jgi:YHS domain-containing protein
MVGIFGFVIYGFARSWFTATIGDSGQNDAGHPDRVDDEMIKDPVCGTYCARRHGVALTTSEKVIYFCSTECRDHYVAQQFQ